MISYGNDMLSIGGMTTTIADRIAAIEKGVSLFFIAQSGTGSN
jgi:hypothetical protein